MAEKEYISKVTLPNESEPKYIKDSEARESISNINAISPLTVSTPPSNDGYEDGLAIGCDARATSTSLSIGCYAWGNYAGDVAIGYASRVYSQYSVSIGSLATCNSPFSVAIGAFSTVSDNTSNEFSIGNPNSRYYGKITRRITNVTDPIYAQDGATKNYVDTKLAEIQALLNKPITWGMLKYGLAYEASTTASEEAMT